MTADDRTLSRLLVSIGSASQSDDPAPSGRRLRRRHLWLIPGLAVAVVANWQAGQHGLGLGPLLLFGIVPHLPALLGVGQQHEPGQMASRAIPLFSVTHHPAPPLIVAGLAAAGVLSPVWLVGGLAWIAHIVTDLAFGHGMRTADGWRRPWWAIR